MLEKIGPSEVIVRNYLDNFNVKEFIQEELIPKAFPDIPLTKLNLGFTGVVSEYISQAIEDSQYTAALMLNEAFPTKATLPESIYAQASLFDLGYQFATPSSSNFAIEILVSDIIENSSAVTGTTTYRFKLDKNTAVVIGYSQYSFDYDVIIDHTEMNGRRIFNVYYDMEEPNSISSLDNKHIKHQLVQSGEWLVLFTSLKEYVRQSDTVPIVDNLITTNSDIRLKWTGQLAGIDLIYISPTGIRTPMILKPKFSRPSVDPFVWYRLDTESSMCLSFSPGSGYWTPDFNSEIEFTIYTCHGSDANFISYERQSALPVKKTGERYSYNSSTTMAAFSLSGSQGGIDQGNIETLRTKVIKAYNSADVLVTENDLQLWFDEYGQRNNSTSKFFKRRDDPSGRLFSQFVAFENDGVLFSTNTLNVRLEQNDFDFVNSVDGINKEFIIKAGHLWEYVDDSRDTVRMVRNTDGVAMVGDAGLPPITDQRPFMFTNPFILKIFRSPTVSASYSTMISHTSYPEEIKVNSSSFYQFQIRQFSIDRTLTDDSYRIEAVCIPVVSDNAEITYVEGIGNEYPKESNNLRLVLTMNSRSSGETGYIEMEPESFGEDGAIVFSTVLPVSDNTNDDAEIEIDTDECDAESIIMIGDKAGKVFIDSEETSFDFICIIKDTTVSTPAPLYGNHSFDGYTITNRFRNDFRSLNLFQPMSMMRNTVSFQGSNDAYEIDVSMIPMLKYDTPRNLEDMKFFIQSFDAQYKAMEPILSRLDGNSFIDFKFYNTYGRSNNYYIGPQAGVLNLKDSEILLDDIHVRVKLIISVYDRTIYTQTVEDVKTQVINQFQGLKSGEELDVYMSSIIRDITDNVPNVRYVRFLGFNSYDANMQAIFVKQKNTSLLSREELQRLVPEIIRVDDDSIEISEET